MPKKRLKTLVITGFSAFYSFLSVKLGILPFANEVYDIICVGATQSFSGPPGTDQREVQGGGMPERTAVAGGPQTAVRRSQFAGRGDLWFTSSLSGLLGYLS